MHRRQRPRLPDAGDGSTVYWHDLASGGNGSFVPATGATVLGPTVNGWMYAAGTGTGGATQLHRVTTSGADTVVGTLANPVDATPISALSYACDATGFAVSGYADNGTKEVEEVVYGAFSGGALTVVSTQTIASANQAYRVVGVAGTTVLYTEETSSGAAVESLYRVAVGGTPTQLRAGAEESVLAATATSTSTAYAVSPPGETAQLYLQPTGGSAGLVTTMPATGEVSVWPNGSAYVVAVAGIGQYTLSGTSLTKTWTPAPGPLAASGVQLSAGRATWVDDGSTAGVEHGWSRPVSGTSSLSGGSARSLADDVTGTGLVADGIRTAWATGTGAVEVDNGQSTSTVSTGAGAYGVVAMSGHRILGGGAGVINLVTGARTDDGLLALWGNTGVRRTAAGGLGALDLTTRAVTTLVAPGQTGLPTGAYVDAVGTEGDLVAWTWYSAAGSGSSGVGWVDRRSGARGNVAIASESFQISVYGHDIAVVVGSDVRLVNAATGTSDSVSLGDVDTAAGVTIGSAGIGWVSRSGQPKVSPLPSQGLAPRHEGNPFAPATIQVGVAPWVGQWVFTEPLTSCAVDIKSSAGTVVRELACNAADAALGEAVVSWDGKGTSGAAVPSGSYTYVVRAAGSGGPALDVDGTSTTISLQGWACC